MHKLRNAFSKGKIHIINTFYPFFMIIRNAKIDDAEQIAKNNVLLARESENANVEYETTLKGVKEVLKDKNKGFYLVAEKNNKIIGQLLVTYEWSDWRDKQIWWLQSIYVIPSERRRGVMRKMIDKILDEAKKRKIYALRLYVHKNNGNAIKAYEKIGMEKKPYNIYQLLL